MIRAEPILRAFLGHAPLQLLPSCLTGDSEAFATPDGSAILELQQDRMALWFRDEQISINGGRYTKGGPRLLLNVKPGPFRTDFLVDGRFRGFHYADQPAAYGECRKDGNRHFVDLMIVHYGRLCVPRPRNLVEARRAFPDCTTQYLLHFISLNRDDAEATKAMMMGIDTYAFAAEDF